MAHGKKEVREAIKALADLGCVIDETTQGHKWGRATAPNGAKRSIWSTPKNPGNHARALIRWARQNQE